MALFSKGITLTQHKEPALSAKLATYINSQPERLATRWDISRNPDELTEKDIIEVAVAAQIFDEGDGRLLASKLRRGRDNKVDTIYIDAIDDEPYVSSQLGPFLQCGKDVLTGIELCSRVIGTKNVVIQIYKHIGDKESSIPTRLGDYRIERITGGYPALPSAQKGRSRNKKEIMIGACALIHLARAVTKKIPQSTAFITVAGNSIANSMNLEVSLGMNFTEIIERCGVIHKPNKVVSGGSMTGISVMDTDRTVVTATTRAILAFHGRSHERAYACIGCGRCEQYCPRGLNPMYIHQTMKQKLYSQLDKFDSHMCIGCGTCSYVCPSRVEVAESAKDAKRYVISKNQMLEEGDDEINPE